MTFSFLQLAQMHNEHYYGFITLFLKRYSQTENNC